jgi:hypothetical protein
MAAMGRLLVTAAALAALGVTAAPSVGAGAGTAAPCAGATQSRVAGDFQTSVLAIYQGELGDAEVRTDAAHVRSSTALRSALASGNTAGVLAATTTIVYHPHWHIVRLQVSSMSGQVLADVGGPDVLAPVRGTISYRGKTVGRYVMSVQDDIGYAKLVTRFTGLPFELYGDGLPLVGESFPTASIPPRVPAPGSSLTIGGVRYEALVYAVKAFPSGRLAALLEVPHADATLAAKSCLAVDASVYTAIAEHLAARFTFPVQAASFITTDHEFYPGKAIFVFRGSRIVARSGAVAPPRHLPADGSVLWLGKRWLINSFAPNVRTRVYILYPAAAAPVPSGPSGATSKS